MESTLSGAAVKIRRLEAQDIDAVVGIQTQCREASQWSRNEYELLAAAAANNTTPCWVAENDGRVAGFLAARKLADELEILNLAVAPASRRQGIAGQLLGAAMKWAAAEGVAKIYLEVRASNARAKTFYESHGFHSTGTRPNYYRDPVDDAVLLTAVISIA
ncbi:MAG TPA: ribosomal protein S18-alanine N-acetyltransferase [Candidatus Acidoferrales bacterium]|nr:ribosomal protein S18-alanine N-acetyltransferase [Candidatus Acidoferrales bacterium]